MIKADFTLIKNLRPGQKNVNVQFIVLDISKPTITKEHHEIRTFKVADKSACINASVWDEPGQLLKPGDICRLTNGYVSLFKDSMTLYTGKSGQIVKQSDFCLIFNEELNMSELNPAELPPLPDQQGKSDTRIKAGR